MAQYQAGPPATPADFPGKTLGIVGLVLSIVASVVGLVVSIIANNQSKAAGVRNGPAKAGIIIGIITTILTVLYIVFIIVVVAGGVGANTSGY